MSAFRLFTEAMGWLQIAASPTLLGLLAAAIVYFSMPGLTGEIIAVSIAVLGLIIGILWANHVAKRESTIGFISKVSATPELDKKAPDPKS